MIIAKLLDISDLQHQVLKRTRSLFIYILLGNVLFFPYAYGASRQLVPAMEYTFCQVGGVYHRVGLIGEAWALEFSFNYDRTKAKSIQIKPEHVKFHQGPSIYHYIAKSAGPRRPDVPKSALYRSERLENVEISLNQRESGLEFHVKEFTSLGVSYEIVGIAPVPCGPFLP